MNSNNNINYGEGGAASCVLAPPLIVLVKTTTIIILVSLQIFLTQELKQQLKEN